MDKAIDFGKIITYIHNTSNTKLRIIKSALLNQSLYISKYSDSAILNFLDELCIKNHYEVIHADHTCMAQHALRQSKKFGAVSGLRLHNIEHRIWQKYADSFPPYHPNRWYLKQQAKLLKTKESDYISKCDAVFPITSDDSQIAELLAPGANLHVAGAGVDFNEWRLYPDENRNPFELIHATVYSWVHNIDAIEWFIERVMPGIIREVPEAKLTLLGKNMPEKLKSMRSTSLNPVGYVEEVKSWYNKASVYVAPLFVGSGVRIKILEAMAMELPVVASPVAAEGIKATELDGLLIANDESQFIKHIVSLLKDNKSRTGLGKKAREYIYANFTWEKSVKVMVEEYQRLVMAKEKAKSFP